MSEHTRRQMLRAGLGAVAGSVVLGGIDGVAQAAARPDGPVEAGFAVPDGEATPAQRRLPWGR